MSEELIAPTLWISDRDSLMEFHRDPIVKSVNSLLNDLVRFFKDFESAVNLCNFCRNQPDFRKMGSPYYSWRFIGARDGGMSLYHIYKIIEAVRSTYGQNPHLRNLVSKEMIRSSLRKFNEKFPFCVKLRHAIAHSAELSLSPNKQEENSLVFSENISGPVKIFISSGFSDDKFSFTYEGIEVFYFVNLAEVVELRNILREFFSSFDAASYGAVDFP